MNDRKYPDAELFRRLMQESRPYWLHLVFLFGLGLLAVPLSLLTPVPLKLVVDNVIGGAALPPILDVIVPDGIASEQSQLLIFTVAFLVLIVAATQALSLGSNYLRAFIGERLVLRFRSKLFEHAQRLSFAYHDRHGTSDPTYRIQYDTAAIKYVAIDGIIPFVNAGFTLITMIVIIVLIDWQLALVALAIAPVLFVLVQMSRLGLRNKARKVKRLESSALGIIQEVLTSLRVVKAFGQEDSEKQRFVDHSRDGVRARLNLTLSESGLGLLIATTTALGTAGVLFIGTKNILAGTLSLGNLLLVMGYLSQLYTPLKTVSRKAASLQSHLSSAERAFSFLDHEPEVTEQPDAIAIQRASGKIEFDTVSFGYPFGGRVLREITFEVPPGMRVGIMGTTGAGKTTLANLITRFYDPSEGTIRLDGVDLKKYKLADLRRQYAVVPQDPILFSTTIAENIEYGSVGAKASEVIGAARAANAHDFIVGLAEGYDTTVGERGLSLSGGERQRVALARAFLKDAPILILDEPTSSVDVGTESVIVEAMDRLMRGRTTFLIAHRLTTLSACDLLLRIENGQLVSMTMDVEAEIQQLLGETGSSNAPRGWVSTHG